MGEPVKIYTKTGDDGTTSLYNMRRAMKNTAHFAALGDIDELNSTLGVVRAFLVPTSPRLSQPRAPLKLKGWHSTQRKLAC